MSDAHVIRYALWRKLLLSAFIVFHWYCVAVYLLPRPSPIKTYLLRQTVPVPTRKPAEDGGSAHWEIRWRPLVDTYLDNTCQWQEWTMFAPNPPRTNLYIAATVEYATGAAREFNFPRVADLNWLDGLLASRLRKYQYELPKEYCADLARYIARQMNEPGNSPTHIAICRYETWIPRHDRAKLTGPAAPEWIDYSRLLRDDAKYTRALLLDYEVTPEDLR